MDDPPPKSAYCIFVNALCEGTVPLWRDEHGWPVLYASEREAQLEIVDDLQERLRQFVAGERDFADAVTIEEFILPVDISPDGSISTEDGLVFGRKT
jgi:hypothetical protein